MADGLFDDLIPQAKRPALGDAPASAASGGLFDDLVPRANPFADVVSGIDTTEALGNVGAVTRVDPNEVIVPEGVAPEPPGLLESYYRRAQAGLEGILGGTSRFLGETLAPVRPQSPLVAAAVDQVLPTLAGTALTDTGVSLGELSAATRAEAQSGERPASIMAALTNPGDTARYYGGIGAESLPAILVALATRNPGAATAVAGGTTAAQSYGDLRQQGVAIPQAIRGATEQGVLEAAGSQAPLERAFGGAPLGRRILQTTGDEVAGEVATQLGQDVAERTGRGEDVPVGELLLGALDAAIASAPGGVVEALGGRGPEPGAVPRETPRAASPPPQAPSIRTEAASPAPNAAPSPQVRTPAAEALDDLDALLEQLPRPEAAAPESPTASPSEPPTGAPPREAAATLPETIRTTGESAVPARTATEAAAIIDRRIEALRDAASGADEARVRELLAEQDELDALVREQDRLDASNVMRGTESRLTPEERASADQRRVQVRTELERARGARDASRELSRLQTRLDRSPRDVDLIAISNEIFPAEAAVTAPAPAAAEAVRPPEGVARAPDAEPARAESATGAAPVAAAEPVRAAPMRAEEPTTEAISSPAEAFRGVTREQFLGEPKITRDSNAAELKPRALNNVSTAKPEPFAAGDGLTAKYSEDGAAVYDGDRVVASYNFGDTLSVDPKYRRQGIASELVYQWRTRNPKAPPAKARTRASQAIQEQVFDRIQDELAPLEDVSVRDRLAERRAEREAERATRTPAGWHVVDEDVRAAEPETADDAVRRGNEDADANGLREPVREVLGNLADRVEFHRGLAGLPERLRKGVEARMALRSGRGKTAGLYDQQTGKVYLFTDVVTNPKRAAFIAAHEIAGHHGLRALLGEKLDPALGIARQNPTVRAVSEAIASERNLDLKTQRGLLLSTEEALAELAAAVRTGNYDEIQSRYKVAVPEGVRGRLKEAIANFLKRLRAAIDDLFGNHQFTDEDVRALLENAWQAANDGTTIDADPIGPRESVEGEGLEATTRMTTQAAEAAAEVRRNDLSQTLPAGRGTIGWSYDDSAWTGTQGQLSNARARLQDKMIAWRDVQDQIASQVGQAIPDTANVYRLENLMHGRVSTGIERIENGQVEPLLQAMNKAGVSQETLEQYLYARHAKERNADIAAKNPAMLDGGSGMTNADADHILADADRATLEPLARRVDAMVRSTRQRMLEAGLISQEQFDAMEAQYTFYVPLRGKRVAENEFPAGGGGAGRGIDTRRSIVKEALGRGAGNRADNILAEVIGDAQRSVILAEKARVGRAVLRLVLANPNPTLWQVEPVQTERKTDAAGEVYEAVVHDWSDPSIIAVKHRGQTYKVQINNVPLANALSNVGVDQLGAVTRAAGAINRYFSAVLTKYNPAFLPVNATRDAIFGMTAMAAEHGERAALDAALHYPQAATAAFRHSIGKPGSGQWDTWAREFADAGGQTGYVNTPSVEDLSRQINGKGQNIVVRALNKGVNTLGLGNGFGTYTPTGIAKAATSVADTIGSMNDAVENALRLSAYVTLRKRGQSVEQAAAYAKDLTVNFNRKGSDGSFWNAWFLFYNAGLQGAKRVSDVMRKPKTWAYLGALSAAQTIAMMYAMGLEDDDGENLWNKVPDHVKRRNLVIVTPDEGVVTIPMPYGFNVFTYMAGRVPAAVLDKGDKRSNTAATVASDVMSTATESFFPVPIGDGALGLLPTILRIPVNVQTNRDDFGREIRRESMAKYDVPRASMGKPDTLEVFKLTAQGMNRLGGGDDYTPPALSWFDVAPEDMEYLLGELGGGAGKFIIDTATVGQNITGGDYSPGVKPKEVPIAGRFYQTIDQEASTAAQFYERRDAINRSLERVRDLYAEKGAEAAEAMLKAAPELKGAKFKRRVKDSDNGPAGSVIESNGRPQIIVAEPKSVFGLYKAAEEAIGERNEGVRQSYTSTPAQIIPTAETRIRDANVRTQNTMRAKAQRDFNTAWSRDVTGSIE